MFKHLDGGVGRNVFHTFIFTCIFFFLFNFLYFYFGCFFLPKKKERVHVNRAQRFHRCAFLALRDDDDDDGDDGG